MIELRKHKMIINRRWNSQQFEFSIDCSMSICISRLKELEATLKLRHIEEQSRPKAPNFPQPFVKIDENAETTLIELSWHNMIVIATLKPVTGKTTYFVGNVHYANGMSWLTYPLIIGFITIAIIAFPFLSAYIASDTPSNWFAGYDTRCIVGLAIILIIVAILTSIGSYFEINQPLNLIVNTLKDCASD